MGKNRPQPKVPRVTHLRRPPTNTPTTATVIHGGQVFHDVTPEEFGRILERGTK
jgi:hypothetical protein